MVHFYIIYIHINTVILYNSHCGHANKETERQPASQPVVVLGICASQSSLITLTLSHTHIYIYNVNNNTNANSQDQDFIKKFPLPLHFCQSCICVTCVPKPKRYFHRTAAYMYVYILFANNLACTGINSKQ